MLLLGKGCKFGILIILFKHVTHAHSHRFNHDEIHRFSSSFCAPLMPWQCIHWFLCHLFLIHILPVQGILWFRATLHDPKYRLRQKRVYKFQYIDICKFVCLHPTQNCAETLTITSHQEALESVWLLYPSVSEKKTNRKLSRTFQFPGAARDTPSESCRTVCRFLEAALSLVHAGWKL